MLTIHINEGDVFECFKGHYYRLVDWEGNVYTQLIYKNTDAKGVLHFGGECYSFINLITSIIPSDPDLFASNTVVRPNYIQTKEVYPEGRLSFKVYINKEVFELACKLHPNAFEWLPKITGYP